jgi:hypothetical protein
MMGTVCWSLTLPLLLGAVQDDLPAGWKVFASKDGRFTVHMPKEPMDPKKQVVKTGTGELNVTLVIAEGRQDSYFVVSYSDFPPAVLKKGEEEMRLDQACNGAVESSRGKLRGVAKPIELAGGYAGREIVIEKDGAVIAKMRIYLVENRLYQIMVLGSGTIFSSKEKDVGIFLDSFRLKK